MKEIGKTIYVCGTGAVSAAGWGVTCLREALDRGDPLATRELARPGWTRTLTVRQVPPASPRPAFLAHARLRRASPVAHYAVGAALEALGDRKDSRLGIVYCTLTGCVNYSRRFYDEVLKDPATASPLVFPETVYNSPASHLAALLGSASINYTLVGDQGTFLQGIALAAEWLGHDRVDGCLVVGAEELDWLTSDALRLFQRRAILGDGAGALYLRAARGRTPAVELRAVTSPQLFRRGRTRAEAARSARGELPPPAENHLLCDGRQGLAGADRDEQFAWDDWHGPRISPKSVLGEAFMAASAWQCVAAVDALQKNRYTAATVSVVGSSQQAIAAQFSTAPDPVSG